MTQRKNFETEISILKASIQRESLMWDLAAYPALMLKSALSVSLALKSLPYLNARNAQLGIFLRITLV